MNKSIALIIPWFGESLKGGAEQHAWQITTRLAARGHSIEVLTTCCRSFFDDWAENYYSSGITSQLGFTVRRFPANPRNHRAFNNLNHELLGYNSKRLLPGVPPVQKERAAIWTQQNINSSALENYLIQYKDNYKAFIFLPYLYGVTLRGLPLVAERAWLQPCLHDEAYAYLPDITNLFYQAHRLLFISAGEMQLAAQLYGPMVFTKGEVAGAGIELDSLISDHRSDLPLSVTNQQFLLCLGRRDTGKGVNRLVTAFRVFRQSHPSTKLHLVLAGPGEECYADADQDIVDLGLVSEKEKAALLQSCLALCQPSTNESFSRVLFEAWICGKPVIAHRNCLATATAVQRSQGGWIAGAEVEWAARMAQIASSDTEELISIGIKGRDYAWRVADWDQVITRYEFLLGLKVKTETYLLPSRKVKAIHQLLPNLAYGDAISNQAIQIREWLSSAGYHSEIFAQSIDPRINHQGQYYKAESLTPTDGLLYHHSIGSDITLAAIIHSGPKILIYHNITPEKFFQPYRPEFARLLRHGREELWGLAHFFPVSIGDSTFNSEELELHGFNSPMVLPLTVDPNQWAIPPDEELMHQLQDGKNNLLFVGRYAPNKCQHHLIKCFAHYLTMDSDARLILIGNGDSQDPYVQYLKQIATQYNISQQIVMPGHITDAQLHAYYRTAHLFWSMSEHEGFCVPLIEAMWFDVPILAFRSSAIPETLADSGVIFNDKKDLLLIAAMARKLIKDTPLNNKIIFKQQLRRQAFLAKNIAPKFAVLVDLLQESATNVYST